MASTLPIQDPILVLALLLAILFVAPAVSARLRLPVVVGLIAFGALVGPGGLGLLAKTGPLETLRSLGLLYLMFLAGLSLDFAQFTALRRRSLIFGALSFGLPQLLALGVALKALGLGWSAALLLGSICGTHTLVALPIAQRLGLGRHAAVTVVAGGTLVCDLLGLGILAAVAASARGQSTVAFWALFALRLGVFVVFVLVVLPRVARWVFRGVSLQPAGELTFLLLVLFGTAWLAEAAGLAPIIGAFLAGLMLNRLVPNASGIMGRVTFVGESLFVPLFLVGVGLLVDGRELTKSLDVWRLAAVLSAIVIVGKGIAALASARVFGHSAAASGLMMGLSIPQAAGTLACTLVGFELALPGFDETMVNAVVVLILVSCLAGSSLVDRAGRAAALEQEAQAAAANDVDAGRILIPLANPATAGALVDLATLVREPGAEDPIHPLTIVRDGRGVEEQVAKSEQMLGEAVLHAVAAGAPVQPATRVDLNAVHGMVRAAKELRTSTIVIGWSGQASAQDRIFGGVLDQLLEQCAQMVLVSKTVAPLAGSERVVFLVPELADRQEGFERANHAVRTLAKNLDAQLLVLRMTRGGGEASTTLRSSGTRRLLAAEPVDRDRLLDELRARVKPSDLLALLIARRDTLAWDAELDRVPSALSNAFERHNLISIHPAVPLQEAASSAEEPVDPLEPGTSELLRELPPQQAVLLREAEPLADVVRRLVAPSLAEHPGLLGDVVKRLLRTAQEHPAEVRPGVLFLQAKAAAWDQPRIFVGTCEQGLTVTGVGDPVRVVVALVSPEGQPPEAHLRNLALVAQAFLTVDSVERLSQARTLDELKALLASGAPVG